MIYYSAKNNAFYDDAIHQTLPPDAIEITKAEWENALNQQANGLVIAPDSTGKPTNVKPTIDPAQVAQSVRNYRDNLLSQCDWTQLPDSPLSATIKAEWATYRQALRDLPTQTGFPSNVTYPTQPPLK